VKSWEYLLNAGIFVWRTDHISRLFESNLPRTYRILKKIEKSLDTSEANKVIKTEYKKVDNTSIDYGIMEKTRDILVIPSDFGWNDVGSWGALLEVLTEFNNTSIITKGHHIGVDNENCLIMASEKLIATVGLKDVVVIDTPDALLICNSNESHKVKDLLNKFKEEGKHLYL
jgi:mannose-1-phosphate guanylyltransferase